MKFNNLYPNLIIPQGVLYVLAHYLFLLTKYFIFVIIILHKNNKGGENGNQEIDKKVAGRVCLW